MSTAQTARYVRLFFVRYLRLIPPPSPPASGRAPTRRSRRRPRLSPCTAVDRRRESARHATVIEPNGQAMAILRVNLRLNDLESRVDTSLLGFGLSDRSGTGDMFNLENNLGGARFDLQKTGPFTLRAGDELLGERRFDFIKIDVEGMEIACLRGLEGLIARCRPVLYVEVDNDNVVAFGEWCGSHGYAVQERIRRYTMNENYLVVPS